MSDPTTVVLTGATSGIGRATALRLAAAVDHLVLHGPEPTEQVTDLLDRVRAGGARVDYLRADYTSLAEARRLADGIAGLTSVTGVDVLVNNAALPGAPHRRMTPDGHERTLQVDYLAPVLLTERLLATTTVRRIVNIASATHLSATLDLDDLELEHRYAGPAAYARSKLALVTWSCWLAEQGGVDGPEVVSMHPGVIATDLLHTMFSIGGDAPDVAAGNVVDVIGRRGDNGSYYDERRVAEPAPTTRDPDQQKRLRDATVALLAPFAG